MRPIAHLGTHRCRVSVYEDVLDGNRDGQIHKNQIIAIVSRHLTRNFDCCMCLFRYYSHFVDRLGRWVLSRANG